MRSAQLKDDRTNGNYGTVQIVESNDTHGVLESDLPHLAAGRRYHLYDNGIEREILIENREGNRCTYRYLS